MQYNDRLKTSTRKNVIVRWLLNNDVQLMYASKAKVAFARKKADLTNVDLD